MRTLVPAVLAIALIAGCGSNAAQHASQSGSAPAGDAQVAAAPKEIDLTNQTETWECPKCGMDFDGPGACSMDGTTLVQMDVKYICPADNQPVASAGKCPRCQMNARVVKTAAVTANPSTN